MDHQKIETSLRAALEEQAKNTKNAAHHVGIIDMDARTVTVVPREQCSDPNVGDIVEWSMPTIDLEGGAPMYGRIHLPLPEPWDLTCEKCENHARVILTQRKTKKNAPIHPRCQDHLAPGSAQAIDEAAS